MGVDYIIFLDAFTRAVVISIISVRTQSARMSVYVRIKIICVRVSVGGSALTVPEWLVTSYVRM